MRGVAAGKGIRLILIAMLVTAVPVPAGAVLGGDAASVEADQAQMRGAVAVKGGTDRFTAHEIRAPSGTAVTEYVSPAGKVFAVSWQGPWPPDLRQILGPYFEQYEQAAARSDRSRRGPLLIEEPGLVVQLNGHPRAFAGRAYVPQLVPEGVDAEATR